MLGSPRQIASRAGRGAARCTKLVTTILNHQQVKALLADQPLVGVSNG